jgi:hypothetical protein
VSAASYENTRTDYRSRYPQRHVCRASLERYDEVMNPKGSVRERRPFYESACRGTLCLCPQTGPDRWAYSETDAQFHAARMDARRQLHAVGESLYSRKSQRRAAVHSPRCAESWSHPDSGFARPRGSTDKPLVGSGRVKRSSPGIGREFRSVLTRVRLTIDAESENHRTVYLPPVSKCPKGSISWSATKDPVEHDDMHKSEVQPLELDEARSSSVATATR